LLNTIREAIRDYGFAKSAAHEILEVSLPRAIIQRIICFGFTIMAFQWVLVYSVIQKPTFSLFRKHPSDQEMTVKADYAPYSPSGRGFPRDNLPVCPQVQISRLNPRMSLTTDIIRRKGGWWGGSWTAAVGLVFRTHDSKFQTFLCPFLKSHSPSRSLKAF